MHAYTCIYIIYYIYICIYIYIYAHWTKYNLYGFGRDALFGGRNDGQIIAWRQNRAHSELKDVALKGHKGNIFSLNFISEYCSGLLISTSADRTIKVWDPWQRDVSNSCIQTLVGHSGSVTCSTFHDEAIISGSSDQTIRIWRPDTGRSLLLYPWFRCIQVIDHKLGWVTSLCVKGEIFNIIIL